MASKNAQGRTVRSLAVAGTVAAVLAAGALAVDEDPSPPVTALVSRAADGGPGGDGNSLSPAISADGRYVAFASRAGNLDPAAPGGPLQIFVRDVVTGAVDLVSRASGAAGAAGDANSFDPSISADGRYVAFNSLAGNLGPEDGPFSDVFVRDRASGATILVSRASGAGGAAADRESRGAAIAADGRHVAFASRADNLSDADGERTDVFVRDLDTGVTELVSVPAPGADGGGRHSQDPSISAHGRFVAFTSAAPLAPDDVDREGHARDVFVRDRVAGATILVSRASGDAGAPGDAESQDPSISADGRHVAFASDAKLTGQRGYQPNVFVRDLEAHTTSLASVGDEGQAGDAERNPAISAHGRYVAFQTRGNELSHTDAGGRSDVFVRDMRRGLTVTVSRASGRLGLPGNGASIDAAISAGGRLVAFVSRATNLTGADRNRFWDVFLRRPVYAEEPTLPECADRPATLLGTPRADVLRGTRLKDIVLAFGGDDRIRTFGAADTICAGRGRDRVDAGSSAEHAGFDLVFGGPGADRLKVGPELSTLLGQGGDDVLIGSRGGDQLYGGPGDDVLLGGRNPPFNSDFLFGGPGDDVLAGGPGPNQLRPGPGRDRVVSR